MSNFKYSYYSSFFIYKKMYTISKKYIILVKYIQLSKIYLIVISICNLCYYNFRFDKNI